MNHVHLQGNLHVGCRYSLQKKCYCRKFRRKCNRQGKVHTVGIFFRFLLADCELSCFSVSSAIKWQIFSAIKTATRVNYPLNLLKGKSQALRKKPNKKACPKNPFVNIVSFSWSNFTRFYSLHFHQRIRRLR